MEEVHWVAREGCDLARFRVLLAANGALSVIDEVVRVEPFSGDELPPLVHLFADSSVVAGSSRELLVLQLSSILLLIDVFKVDWCV